MKNPMGNMGNLLKQAQAMQAQMAKVQEQASSKTVTGTAGGGSVMVTANGAMELVGIVIDPEVVKSGDVEMVQRFGGRVFGILPFHSSRFLGATSSASG